MGRHARTLLLLLPLLVFSACKSVSTSAPVSAQPAEAADPRTTNMVRLVTVEDLLQEAASLQSQGKLNDAETVLTKVVRSDRDNLKGWRALAAVHRELAEAASRGGERFGNQQSLLYTGTQWNKNDLLVAGLQLNEALSCLEKIKELAAETGSGVDPRMVAEEEKSFKATEAFVKEAVDRVSKMWVDRAQWHAEQARRIPPEPNDQSRLVQGLRAMQKVLDLGPWLNHDVRAAANDAMAKLKELTGPDAWNDLRLRAGLPPEIQETLK